MRRYTTLPGVIAVVAAALVSFIPSIPRLLASLLLIASLCFFVYWTRGNIIYSRAMKALRGRGKNGKSAEELFEKALKTGIPDQYAIFASSILLAGKSNEVAAAALQPLTESKDDRTRGMAKSTLSMHYWFSGDHDKAIELAESAIYEDGLKDRNTYTNICCYYLKEGRTDKFRKLVGEVHDNSPVFTHFKAVSYMIEGSYREAGIMLSRLFSESSPSYPDPYVNFAVVHLHYGVLDKAEEYAKMAAMASAMPELAVYSKDFIDGFCRALSDPEERIPFMEAVNRNIKLITLGKLPEWKKADQPFTGSTAPGFPPEPDFGTGTIDRGDISTTITDDDEEWIRKHEGSTS